MTTTRATTAIVAAGLRKSFGEKLVLDGVDLTVPEATVFATVGDTHPDLAPLLATPCDLQIRVKPL